MGKTLEEYFGPGTIIDNTNPNDPKLIVPLVNFVSVGLNIPLDSASRGEPIIGASIEFLRTKTEAKTDDPTWGVVVESPLSPQFSIRGEETHLQRTYQFSTYEPSPAPTFDPDNIV